MRITRDQREAVVRRSVKAFNDSVCGVEGCRCCKALFSAGESILQKYEDLSADIDGDKGDPDRALLRLAWSAFQDNPEAGESVNRDYESVLAAMKRGVN